MKKQFIAFGILILLITVCFSGCLEDNETKEKVSTKEYDIYVDDDGTADYVSIQDAINASEVGDRIFVNSGTYFENIVINKSIDLIGSNDVKIIGNHSGIYYIVKFSSNWINMSNFNIFNERTGSISGISIENFENLSIKNCKITFCRRGILISGSKNIFIESCNCSSNTNGISLFTSDKIEVINCLINNSSNRGLYLEGVSNSNITRCSLLSNGKGIEIRSHHYPFVGFEEPMPLPSVNNTVYLCSFIDNIENAYEESSFIYGANKWYDSSLELGNYWDDYDNTRFSGIIAEGVGDTPYNISSGVNQDKFPLIREGFVPGEILVLFNGNITQEEITELAELYNLSIIRRITYSNSISTLIKVPTNEEAYWIKIFKNVDNVEAVSLNLIVHKD